MNAKPNTRTPVSFCFQISDLSADAANVATLLDLAVENLGTDPEQLKRTACLIWTARELAEQMHNKAEAVEIESRAAVRAAG